MEKLSKYYLEILKLLKEGEKDTNKLLLTNYKSSLIEMKKLLNSYLNRYGELSFQEWLKVDRLKSLINQINVILDNTYKNNETLISNHAQDSYSKAYNGLFYQLEVETGLILDFTMIDTKTVEKAIQMPIDGLRLSERLYDKHLHNLKLKTKGALTRGLINGSGYRDIAGDISNIGVADYKQALRIAITEGNRLRSLAREDSYQEASKLGIGLKKRWLSTLDHKTRDTHRALDGVTIGIDEEFEIRGYKALQPRLFGVASEDIHCRCDTISIVEDIAPNLRRDNTTGEIIEYENYNEWYSKRFGDDVYKGGYWYTKDDIIKITEEHKGEHYSPPRKHKPYAVIESDKVSKNGFNQVDRTLYDKDGMMVKQIHSGHHNRPKQHPYGKHGEHIHIYKWDKEGKMISREVKELTEKERRQHRDILKE
ncbi:phage minor head protein [Clostridium botulinum]|uniref:phage minor head protein n=1 Tax=Clostridium botulinum TaxID=1491 RepID=UPI0004D76C09|nr:phage minor head protein [Clostridium botulinum]KEH97205.1 head protein [Clostridium botulinum D str. 16868]NFF59796.1 head protein [Clostridium botulinum]NFL02114.1 head protein [Clostridium botulinum]